MHSQRNRSAQRTHPTSFTVELIDDMNEGIIEADEPSRKSNEIVDIQMDAVTPPQPRKKRAELSHSQ